MQKFDAQKIFFKNRDIQCEIGRKHGAIDAPHTHDNDFQFEVLLDGRMGDLSIRNSDVFVPGMISVYNPSDPHRTDYQATNSLFFFVSKQYIKNFYFEHFGLSEAIFNQKKAHNLLIPDNFYNAEILQLEHLGSPSDKKVPIEHDFVNSLMREEKSMTLLKTLLFSLASSHGIRQANQESKGYHESVVHRSIEYMQDSYREDIDLERIASESGMSSFHFSRIFKKVTGKSPYQYLIQLRVEKAQRDINVFAGENLSNIAHKYGFKDQKQMLYHLKKHD